MVGSIMELEVAVRREVGILTCGPKAGRNERGKFYLPSVS